MTAKKPPWLNLALMMIFALAACGDGSNSGPQATDYSQPSHCLSSPAVVKNVDVFYLYPDVYGRMVAAYIIGHPVTDAYLAANPHLKFATGPDDTGVIMSWNTEAPVIGDINPVLYGLVGRVINPLTWTTEETLVDNSHNLGSIRLNANGTVAKDANAQNRVNKYLGL